MKVLSLCNAYPPAFQGGAELIAHNQALALVRRGHDVEVLAGDSRSTRKRHTLRSEFFEGLRVHRIHLASVDHQADFVNFAQQQIDKHFTSVFDRFRPDVVHAHNLVGLSLTPLRIASEAGARVVLTLHDHWGYCLRNTATLPDGTECRDHLQCASCKSTIGDGNDRDLPIRLRMDFVELMMDEVDAFVSPSRFLAKTYAQAGFPEDRLNVVRNGIDFDRFAELEPRSDDGRVHFSFIGHFGRHKGLATLADAFGRMRAGERARLDLIGDGELRNRIEKRLAPEIKSSRVRFWGKLQPSAIVDAYAQTDVLVLPSVWRENQPVTITEAMAAGRPVIASRTGGIPELVEHGETGLTFEPGNVEELARCMDLLTEDPLLRARMGAAGRERMRENHFDAQAAVLERLFEANSRRHAASSVPLVACIGERFDPRCAEALERLDDYADGARVRVVMADWLTSSQRSTVSVLWAIDKEGLEALERNPSLADLPLLVPAESERWTRHVRERACGLYYRTADEAAACIARLVPDAQMRAALARSARAAIGAIGATGATGATGHPRMNDAHD